MPKTPCSPSGMTGAGHRQLGDRLDVLDGYVVPGTARRKAKGVDIQRKEPMMTSGGGMFSAEEVAYLKTLEISKSRMSPLPLPPGDRRCVGEPAEYMARVRSRAVVRAGTPIALRQRAIAHSMRLYPIFVQTDEADGNDYLVVLDGYPLAGQVSPTGERIPLDADGVRLLSQVRPSPCANGRSRTRCACTLSTRGPARPPGRSRRASRPARSAAHSWP